MSVDFSQSHKAMDVGEHKRTYSGFITATKISTVATVVILILLAAFLL